jgi:hypothetical protein
VVVVGVASAVVGGGSVVVVASAVVGGGAVVVVASAVVVGGAVVGGAVVVVVVELGGRVVVVARRVVDVGGRVVVVGVVVIVGGAGATVVGGPTDHPGAPGLGTPGTTRAAPTYPSRQIEAIRTTSPVWGACTISPLPMYSPTWWIVAGLCGSSP